MTSRSAPPGLGRHLVGSRSARRRRNRPVHRQRGQPGHQPLARLLPADVPGQEVVEGDRAQEAAVHAGSAVPLDQVVVPGHAAGVEPELHPGLPGDRLPHETIVTDLAQVGGELGGVDVDPRPVAAYLPQQRPRLHELGITDVAGVVHHHRRVGPEHPEVHRVVARRIGRLGQSYEPLASPLCQVQRVGNRPPIAGSDRNGKGG